MIFTDETEITKENIAQVIGLAQLVHDENVRQEIALINYETGNQDILDREKPIRPDINNRIVENNASKIVDVHLSYCFSNPVAFIQKKSVGGKNKDDESFTMLNRMMQSRFKAKKDTDMAHRLMTVGVSYMMAWPSRDKNAFSPFDIMVLDSLTTYVVYTNDVFKEPILAVTYCIHEDGTVIYTAYSKDKYFKVQSTDGAFGEPVVMDNVLGRIPIVEFSLTDRMGVFEKVIPIMDALNTINSDRVNDIAQHVQSLLWLNNCDLTDDQKSDIKENGGIISTHNEDGKQASIAYLSQTLNQSEIQDFVNYYQSAILQITHTPSWQEASGGSTTGAMQLSNGWQSLELSAKTVEMLFDEPEHRLLDVVMQIIKDSSKDYGALKAINPADIEIKFNRNKTFDLISKTNALVSLINAGINGLDAFATVNLFTDPQATWDASKKTIEGMQKKLYEQQKAEAVTNNIIPNANAAVDKDGKGGANNKKKDKTDESRQPSKVAEVTE